MIAPDLTTAYRAEELPSLSSPYALASELTAQYRAKGHVTVPGLMSRSETAAYLPVIEEAVRAFNPERRRFEDRDTYGKAFLQTMNLWELEARLRAFSFARRFARVAAELMGVPAVRLYHDQALFKEVGGGHTPWHQDQYYWPLATPHTITLWIALSDLTREMGLMRFASGSQREGSLEAIGIGDESERKFSDYVRERGFELSEPEALDAGDATFHAGWTLHSASPNRSARLRPAMTVIYFAEGARVSTPSCPEQEFDRQRWLPGCAPGDLAASDLNPVLYAV